MRTFRVVVNGNEYEVAIEEIGGSGSPAPAATPARIDRPASEVPAPVAKPIVRAPLDADVHTVIAQMPGTIVEITVAVGDAVTRGRTMLILEAMKMANEVVAPKDAVVQEIVVAKGASVNAGDVLVILK